MIQIWHGESGLNSREFIRGFSCQNWTPNTWSLILNLGRDLYHGTCWSFWLEALEKVHVGDLNLHGLIWAWLLLALQPLAQLDTLGRSSGGASCCPAFESQVFTQLQGTWPCARRSFGGCQWHCKTLGFILELRDGPVQGRDPGKGTWKHSGLLSLSIWLHIKPLPLASAFPSFRCSFWKTKTPKNHW